MTVFCAGYLLYNLEAGHADHPKVGRVSLCIEPGEAYHFPCSQTRGYVDFVLRTVPAQCTPIDGFYIS